MVNLANAETVQNVLISSHERDMKKNLINMSLEEINAYYRKKNAMNMVMPYNGGAYIRIPFAKQVLGTLQFYEDMGVYETKRVHPNTQIQAKATQAVIPITLSMRQILDNSGETKIFDILKDAKAKNRIEIANTMSHIEYGSGARAKSPLGLQNHLTTDGLGRVHTIDSASVPLWRNQSRTVTSNPTFEQLMKGLDELYLDCCFQTKPNLILITNDWWQIIAAGMRGIMRTQGKRSGVSHTGLGDFDHYGGEIVHDFNSNFGKTAQKAYMINTRTVGTFYHRNRNWKAEKQMKPDNQDVIVLPTYWMGQNMIFNRKFNGVLTAS